MNLKQKLAKKLKKSGGFTLIEMLIVVAIIAILVAVSIPMVNTSLEKARVNTDAANERAAKGAAMIQYLSDGETADVTYAYDAENGTVKKQTGTVSSVPTGIDAYGQCKNHQGGCVIVEITDEGSTVKISWVGGTKSEPDGVTATKKPTTSGTGG